MATTDQAGLDALNQLKSTEPPLWLAPNPSLSETARTASQHLFSSLSPFAPKSPFEKLLVEGFDAEQIWQQIDLQSQPLLSNLRRELKRFEKNPEQISTFFGLDKVTQGEKKDLVEEEKEGQDEESEDFDAFDEDEEEGEEEEEKGGEEDARNSEEKEGEEERQGGIEDGFLKINELEKFLEEDEAREYGLEEEEEKKKKKKKKRDEAAEQGEEEDEGDDDELDLFGDVDGDDDDEGMEDMENARYEDFFVPQKKNNTRRKSKMLVEESEEEEEEEEEEDSEMGDEMDEDEAEEGSNLATQERELDDLRSKVKQMEKADVNKDNRSTHEKELEKLRSKIEEMEKAMLEPKPWIMQGEVTAAQRPKNSALEVDLDFEHNVRPAPVITEEVKVSLEEMIQKRILEGHFNDVQKPPSLPTKAPREYKELDENKSKKSLAEIYEEEYAEKTNLVPAALSLSDELKKEASMLFKKLCLKLDALSHFHFTPKPVIEDMSIQANVPALAMEEIAPVAVSDAAMLAPEEVFSGKGDIKEEPELTQAERKRRRARKKRKYKAEAAKRTVKKARDGTVQSQDDGKN